MKKIAFLFAALLFVGCKPAIQVQSLDEVQKVSPNTVVYALPKTVIKVEVKAEKITTKKGPFYLFADKLLDEDNVVATDKIQWRLREVKIGQYTIPDTSHYYVVQARKPHFFQHINLRENGVLVGLNTMKKGKVKTGQTRSFLKKEQQEPVSYKELTVEKNLKEKVDTVYRGGGIDTLFLKIPSLKRQILEKSTGEKARAAANFIFKLRQKRYQILFGEGKGTQDGEALKKMLAELDKLEEQFTSLFTGIRYSTIYQDEFEFVPTEGGEISQHLLFRFSETRGILPPDSRIGTPIYLESNKLKTTSKLDKFNRMHTAALKDPAGLIYRLPEKARIKLFRDRKAIAEKFINVAQYGKTMRLPADLAQDNVRIGLYPETGALQFITNNEANGE